MSFVGSEFIFNGTSSLEFGLYLYTQIGNASQETAQFAASPKFQEDKPLRRYRSLCYGAAFEDNLKFKLVFGANPALADSRRPYDRSDLEKIASWLTGHTEYQWLYIVQDDMESVRYHCYISGLQSVEVGSHQWGFQCDVVCDSPFGYLTPKTYSYTLNGTRTVMLRNRSSMNGYYSPALRFSGAGDFSISNQTDSGRTMRFSGIPASAGTITVDSENQIIQAESGLNLYPYFNFKFLRLVRGDNTLVLSGSGKLDIMCEFPINIGG